MLGLTSLSRMRLFVLGLAHVLVIMFILTGTSAQDPDYRPRRVVPSFPPITEFETKSVSEVGEALGASELVLGVSIGDQSRAYPINMLTGPRREIINDELAGHAIAATW